MSWNLVGSLTLQIPAVLWLPRQHETFYFWSLRYIVYHEQGQQSVATNSTGKDDLKLQQKLCDAQWIVFITVPFKKLVQGGTKSQQGKGWEAWLLLHTYSKTRVLVQVLEQTSNIWTRLWLRPLTHWMQRLSSDVHSHLRACICVRMHTEH